MCRLHKVITTIFYLDNYIVNTIREINFGFEEKERVSVGQ